MRSKLEMNGPDKNWFLVHLKNQPLLYFLSRFKLYISTNDSSVLLAPKNDMTQKIQEWNSNSFRSAAGEKVMPPRSQLSAKRAMIYEWSARKEDLYLLDSLIQQIGKGWVRAFWFTVQWRNELIRHLSNLARSFFLLVITPGEWGRMEGKPRKPTRKQLNLESGDKEEQVAPRGGVYQFLKMG